MVKRHFAYMSHICLLRLQQQYINRQTSHRLNVGGYFFLAGALAPLRGVPGLDLGDCFLEEPADFFPFFGSGVGSGSGGALGSLFTVCWPVKREGFDVKLLYTSYVSGVYCISGRNVSRTFAVQHDQYRMVPQLTINNFNQYYKFLWPFVIVFSILLYSLKCS